MHQPPENKGGSRNEPETARTEDLGRVKGSQGTAKSKPVDAGNGVFIDSQKPSSMASKPLPNGDGGSTKQKTDQTGVCPPLERQVGMFRHHGDRGQNVDLMSILNDIREGKWADQINKLRALVPMSPEFIKAKEKLPSFLISGSTASGHTKTSMITHSGLLQIDIDELEEVTGMSPEDLRDRIGDDRHILATFISPSGLKVKAIMLIPADLALHDASYNEAEQYMLETYKLTIDRNCKNVNRLCYISSDLELKINSDAIPLPLSDSPSLPKGKVPGGAGKVPAGKASADRVPGRADGGSSAKSASCILHNKCFNEFPKLRRLYYTFVGSRYRDIQPGNRNAALCEIVPLLYCAIHERFILPFMEEFYAQGGGVFSDSLADHLKEARCLLEGTKTNYLHNQLSMDERVRYALCSNENERATFRFCHSLAICDSGTHPPPSFFLSCAQLATRLGCLPMEAYRILQRLCQNNVIREVEKGTHRGHGGMGQATIYRWLLPSLLVKDVGLEWPPSAPSDAPSPSVP